MLLVEETLDRPIGFNGEIRSAEREFNLQTPIYRIPLEKLARKLSKTGSVRRIIMNTN